MSSGLFDEYCSMLFSILDEFDKQKTLHDSFQDDRTDGYLGEYFLGIYITYLRANGFKIMEVSRIDTDCSFSKRCLYYLLPPESWQRTVVRKIQRRLSNRKGIN